MPHVNCHCGGNAVLIATGEVNIYRCSNCFENSTRCVKCNATVGGTKESEWLEMRCRNEKCGHTTNIRKLTPPDQLRLPLSLVIQR